MRGRLLIPISFIIGFFLLGGTPLHAQFKEKEFSQTYNDKVDSLATKDSTDKLVNFQEIFGGLAHKRTMRIGTMFGTSILLPGASQIYNQQYWKLPIIYTGIVGGLAAGITCGQVYNNTGDEIYKTASTWTYVAAGVFYYASLMDGAICYKSDRKPLPGRATIYSILLPGLGQAYNGEYWKIPIYVGGIVGSLHFFSTNNTNYKRYRDIYREASQEGYSGPISATQAKYYRDEYRRYRDYSLVALAAFYLLQIIDANVFCYMNNFEVSDNVTASMAPSIILPEKSAYAIASPNKIAPAAGVSLALKF